MHGQCTLARSAHRFTSWLIVKRYLLLMVLLTSAKLSRADNDIRFNRDVRPILSTACFRCHGFDVKTREANLRLDTADGAFEKRENGDSAIVPGDLNASLVWQRVTSPDADVVMPPPESKHQLTDAQKEVIRQWIEQGASYQNHWSFEPIVNAPVLSDSASSLIDQFIEREIASRGFSRRQYADPSTLLRRLSFALTGLPPTLEETTRFQQDPSEAAYREMVDHYLNSPRYGEEMAKHWLDVARYGDTHGLHLDNERQMWAYRDWVIDAFNRNLPFSEFTIEQLAGDLLPSPTQSQLVATGFNRCNVTTGEGGAIDDEFRYRYAVDRTNTTIQTWLGLTGGCAVCHDHKYDPITSRDYYSFYAFFNNAMDPPMDGNIDSTAPFLRLSKPEQDARRAELEQQQIKAKADLELAALQVVSTPPSSTLVDETWMDDDLPIGFSSSNTSRNATRWSDVSPGSQSSGPVAKGLRALRQEFGDRCEERLAAGWFPLVLPVEPVVHVQLRVDSVHPPLATFLEIITDKGSQRWIWSNDEESGKKVGGETPLGPLPVVDQWTTLEIPAASIKLPAGAQVTQIKLGQFGGICWWDDLGVRGTALAETDPRKDVKAWWASRKDKDTPIGNDEVKAALKQGPPLEGESPLLAAVETLYRAYVEPFPQPTIAELRGAVAATRVEIERVQAEIPGTFTFADSPQPRQSFVMVRGQYDKPGDAVQATTPGFLPPMRPADPAKPTRLDLAKWLVSDDHPLTSRVTINRFWQQIFGIGLVKTSDDFGTQGSLPSHPELLDHLATAFRDDGWDVKSLIRTLVLSDAFRRDASVTPDLLAADPENRFLARGPRLRLDAEQVRDNALAVSGLLSVQMGGPGTKTYQPENIWEPVGYGDSNTRYYLRDRGESVYRRSIYSFLKRTAPAPFMSNFDAPNRELFCTRRERSNTPLQSLQLMNDVQFVEAARALAQRMIEEGGATDEERLKWVFLNVLSRPIRPSESGPILSLLAEWEKRYIDAPDDARKLVQVGQTKVPDGINEPELAAYTLVANLVLNLDETINR